MAVLRIRRHEGGPPTIRAMGSSPVLRQNGLAVHRLDGGRLRHFIIVGSIASGTQLALLALLIYRGMPDDLADVVALLLAAQISFALNSRFTWHDRATSRRLLTQWMLFHVSVASTTTLNVLVLSLLGSVVHPVPAASVGIAVGSVLNFLLNDRLVFR